MDEVQAFVALGVFVEGDFVVGKVIRSDELTNVAGEVRQAGGAAGLLVELSHGDPPPSPEVVAEAVAARTKRAREHLDELARKQKVIPLSDDPLGTDAVRRSIMRRWVRGKRTRCWLRFVRADGPQRWS